MQEMTSDKHTIHKVEDLVQITRTSYRSNEETLESYCPDKLKDAKHGQVECDQDRSAGRGMMNERQNQTPMVSIVDFAE